MRMSLLLLPVLSFNLSAQEADLPIQLQRTQRLGTEALQGLQAKLAMDPAPVEQKAYFQALVGYTLASHLQNRDAKASEALLDRTLKSLEGRKDAESLALLGACFGLKIGFSPNSGMTLAPKALGLFQQALKLSPGNPRVLFFQGLHVYHTPDFIGGGAEKALPILEAAEKAASGEKPAENVWAPRWGKAESLAWLALAQLDQHQAEAANLSLNAALAMDEDYAFAVKVVKPKVDAELAKVQK
jgi:tetratricopeptide (TPR) repeat protein